MSHRIAPSMLSADFAHLAREVKMVNESKADWFHIDVMDGTFVPNISFGFPALQAVKKYAEKPLDVHLMVDRPERYIKRYREFGADHLSIHIEACVHLHAAIMQIKKAGMKAGIAINPATSLHHLEEILPLIDIVCFMSVNPGFGGQGFIPQSLDKISRLKAMIRQLNPSVLIEVDGGVKLDNAKDILQAGADVLVSGSGIFGTPDPLSTIETFKTIKADTLAA